MALSWAPSPSHCQKGKYTVRLLKLTSFLHFYSLGDKAKLLTHRCGTCLWLSGLLLPGGQQFPTSSQCTKWVQVHQGVRKTALLGLVDEFKGLVFPQVLLPRMFPLCISYCHCQLPSLPAFHGQQSSALRRKSSQLRTCSPWLTPLSTNSK